MKQSKQKTKSFQVVARQVSVCGWKVEASNLAEARRRAHSGPDYAALDFDEPDSFEICTVKPTKVYSKRGTSK